MRTNALLVLIWLAVAAVAYNRLPELLQEWTRDVHRWQVNMLVTSAALGVAVVFGLACVAVLVANWWTIERPANRAARRRT